MKYTLLQFVLLKMIRTILCGLQGLSNLKLDPEHLGCVLIQYFWPMSYSKDV